jgi:hypothetical protein
VPSGHPSGQPQAESGSAGGGLWLSGAQSGRAVRQPPHGLLLIPRSPEPKVRIPGYMMVKFLNAKRLIPNIKQVVLNE